MKKTFNDPEIRHELRNYAGMLDHPHFYDVDDPVNAPYIEWYKPAALPCVIIVNDEGYEINRVYGYKLPFALKRFLKELPANRIRQ